MLKVEYSKPVIYKNSDSMGVLIMKEIPIDLAKDMCIRFHYAHKWNANFGRVNIGIFQQTNPNKCLGVASFGNMMHPTSFNIIANNIKQDEILELNRLWIDDCLDKNAETMLLSASFKILKWYGKIRIVQSFADGRLGCGTIYKASNFGYYGVEQSLFYKNIETGVIYFNTLFTNTTRPTRMVHCITEMCKGNVKAFNVNSYRYLYKIDKSVNIIMKQEPYPKYQKGEIYIDDKDMYDSKVNEIFRGYILSHLIECDINSKHFIAIYIKEHFNENFINEIMDKQMTNGEIIKEYSQSKEYINLSKTNYMKLLEQDIGTKRDTSEEVDLW